MDKNQNVFSISDAQIAPIVSNTQSTYTKGEYIAVPELTTMDVTLNSETKEATYGAGLIADSFTIKKGFDVKFESVNIPLDVIALINGATVTSSGTGATEVNVLTEKTTDIPAVFNLAFKTDFVNGDPADFHMELFCVKGQMDVITKADDYWTCSFEGKAVAKKSTGEFRAITANKEKKEIAEDEQP